MRGNHLARRTVRPLLTAALAFAALLVSAAVAAAQTPQGATLTVTSGEVGVLTSRGSPVQPAASGMTLGVGDQVATIGRSTALITFFEGSELELAEKSTIIIRQVEARGTEVHVNVEDVLGTSVGRVTAFVNPNSSFQIQSPGGRVVALIRGSRAEMTVFESGAVNVSVSDCSRECDIIVDGGSSFSGTGGASVGIDQAGGVHQGGVQDVSVPGTGGTSQNPGGTTGTAPAGSSEPGGSGPGGAPQDDDSDDDDDSGYGYRGWTPLLGEKLRDRLTGETDPLTAAGAALALGMVGATMVGRRRRP